MRFRNLMWMACIVTFMGMAWGAPASDVAAPQTRPAPVAGDKRVLIISVDGMRPDLALRADTPTIHDLIKHGTYTFWARTTALSVTLPSHTSMLTGVTPAKHDIDWNSDMDLKTPIYPRWPTLFEVARKAGYTTAMVAGKAKFCALEKPDTLDWSIVPAVADGKLSDQKVGDQTVALIREHKPQVLFVHFPEVDTVGHAQGWSSPEHVKAIERADAQVARVIQAFREAHKAAQILIIVTADHGGAGRNHGPDDPRSRHIPWIAVGPGVHENFDLTIYPRLTVNIEDTFATACWFLGIPLAGDLDGKPVEEIVNPVRAVGRYE